MQPAETQPGTELRRRLGLIAKPALGVIGVLFSAGLLEISAHLLRLDPSLVAPIMCVQSWRRSGR
jgi:hypothetical protein